MKGWGRVASHLTESPSTLMAGGGAVASARYERKR
jgi:hypothetical protein